MKITIKENKKVESKITIKDIEPGYVFEILESGSVTHDYVKALKLENDEVVLLTYCSGRNWLEIREDETWENSPVKILGKLTEIIVDPNV